MSLALRAAESLKEGDSLDDMNPFLESLFNMNLKFYQEFFQETNDETQGEAEAKDSDSGLIIT